MITAESIIGKLVLLIVNKTIGKLLDIPFDKKRKACRSLTKLYFCLQTLDEVTESFFETLEDFSKEGDARAVVNALNNHSYEIEFATNMFIDLSFELYDGLEIIDPALARCCKVLYESKFDFLYFMSKSISWERESEKTRIHILVPQGKMESTNLEKVYDDASKLLLTEGNKYYFPTSALDDFEEDFQDISISFEDDETANWLKMLVLQQNIKLKEAKEKLRILLKDSFSIEELLFQNNSRHNLK